MAITTVTNLDYLIDGLRLKIGDTEPTTYRYTDDWLRTTLVLAVKNLQRYWRFKYLIDVDNNAYRNPLYVFDVPEPPIIQNSDEYLITLMAAIIILEGSLENSAWDAVSWKDNEISFSNLERFRTKNSMLDRMVQELNSLILPPTKRLARPSKQSLPGYLNNEYERKGRL